jgi:small-conductance mechanosensitive channel
MGIEDLEKLADRFEAQLGKEGQAVSDDELVDRIARSLDTAQSALQQGAAQVARFKTALVPLQQAKARWNSLSPQVKLQLINNVFQQYADLPQSYMDPNDFRPVQLRDNISRLFSQLVSRYRG